MGRHVTRKCTLSFKMASTSSDLYLFGEGLDIFLDFMDDDEDIQDIFDEKVDEVRSHDFFVQLKYNSFNLCA